MKISNSVFFAEVEHLISLGQEVTVTVVGTSMMPFLRNGRDRVVLVPFSEEELKRGAVVLFRYGGRHLLHRIVRRTGDALEIQGDNVYTTEQATVADVVAVVREVIRPSGHVIHNGSVRWRVIWVFSARRRGLRKILSALKRRMKNLK
jgi:phage repressor protein C with HTH and peptisase S24 domain